MHNRDAYANYLVARDLTENLLLEYAREGSDFRREESNVKFRQLADRLGFTVIEKNREAAE